MNWKKTLTHIKKTYSIKDICDIFGISYKERHNRLFIFSTYNVHQKTPSLIVFRESKKNATGLEYAGFHDYLTGKTGDVIEFVRYYFHLNSTQEALNFIAQSINMQIEYHNQNINYQKKIERIKQVKEENINTYHENNSRIEIKKIRELQNKILIKYLERRGISIEIAKKAGLKELYYTLSKGKEYFGLAFENDKGGYELRNSYFKGNLKVKSITTIINNNSNELNVYEGFIDYLSAAELSDGKILRQNNIILNSVAETKKAIDKIKELKHINKIKLYLDADEAGKRASKEFKEAFQGSEIKVVDYSYILEKNGVKDINDFLVKKRVLHLQNEDEDEK